MEKWSIHIDMEGFSSLWEKEDKILLSLCELMRAIFRIGRICYPNSPERLFVHQLGDGFLIKSDFHEESLERAITISVALMQHVASTGRFVKTAISEGNLPDIRSCYPKEVIDNLEEGRTISLGMGLMTVFPVMGTALIRAIKIANDSPRGPLLIVEASKNERIPANIPVKNVEGKKYKLLSIDWVHMESDLLQSLQQKASLYSPSNKTIEYMLIRYCKEHCLPSDWKKNVNNLLSISKTQNGT